MRAPTPGHDDAQAIYRRADRLHQLPRETRRGGLPHKCLVWLALWDTAVNPALQTQLERLAQNLAARSQQPVALFTLPETEGNPTRRPTPRAPERPPELFDPVLRRATAAPPLQEALASF